MLRFSASDGPLPAAISRASTHSGGVAAAIELARALGSLPRRLIVFVIEGTRFAPGDDMSAGVEAAIPKVAELVTAELSCPSAQPDDRRIANE